MGLQWVSLDCSGYHWTAVGIMGLQWVSWDCSGYHWTAVGIMGLGTHFYLRIVALDI
jgi:hypothetical protein